MEPHIKDQQYPRGLTQETFISDLSSYDREAQYVGPSKRGSTFDEEEGEEDEEQEEGEPSGRGPYSGPTAWEDVDQGDMELAADQLVRIFAKATDEEDALLRQVAAAAAALDEQPRDPLGLGTIDINTLKLSSQELGSTAGRKFTSRPTPGARTIVRTQKQRAQDAEKILPSGSAFSPELYLSTIHENSSLQDLEEGMQALETELSKRTGQLKKLVKENFERFISCKNTIDDVHIRLRRSETDKKGINTQSLRASISQVQEDADRAFAPLLERNQKLQQIKSVMGVIKRFWSVFGLPSRVKQLAHLQDYSQVVTEYKRAKAMMAGSEVATWNSLFAEVEKGVSDVCNSIIEGLENPDLEPELVEEFAIHVMQFQNEGLPSAQGIQPVGLWLASLEHYTHDEINAATQHHLLNLAKFVEQRRRPSGLGTSALHGTMDKTKAAEGVHTCWADHVSALCEIVLKYVPAAWTIGNSSQLKEVSDLNPTIEETMAASLKGAERVCRGIMESFHLKVMESIDALLTNQGLLPTAVFSVLKTLRCTASNLMVDKGPPLLITTLHSLLKECHKICGGHLCKYLRQQMDGIADWEDWVVTLGSRNAGLAFTRVPSKLRTAVCGVMDQYIALTREQEEHPPVPNEGMNESIQAAFYECFELFAAAVEGQAASAIKHIDEDEETKHGKIPFATSSNVSNISKLLVLVGNCRSIRKQVLSDLTSEYADVVTVGDHFANDDVPKIALLESTFEELEEHLLGAYIAAVTSRLEKMVQRSVEEESIKPPRPNAITSVSDGPIEWIHCLVEVQAEVYEIAPCKQHIIMDQIILHLVSVLQYRSHQVGHLGYHVQMYLDLSFLEATLTKYQSRKLDDAWDLAYENAIGQVIACLSDAESDKGDFQDKLDPAGGAVEVDKQLQVLCKEILKGCMHKMGVNILCMGVGA